MRFSRELLMILVLGFLLRVWGIWFGLPGLFHADEPALVNHAMAHGAGDLNPHYFKLPALLNYYLLSLFGGYFALGRMAGWFPNVGSFALLFFEEPTSFYLIGRLFTGVLFGVVGIYLIYRLGREMFSEKVGLLAGFFLACTFLHVRDSHYVIYDIPLASALTGCFLPITRVARNGHIKDYLLFGSLAGLATAIKYNGSLILLPFLLAHFSCSPRKGNYLIAGLAVALLAYVLGDPFSVIDFRSFWKDLSVQAGAESPIGLFHHLKYSLTEGMGLPLLATSILGLLGLLKSREKARIILALFVVSWIVYIGCYSQPYERYALPSVPFLCLSAAAGVCWGLEALRIKSGKMLWSVITLVVSGVPLTYSIYSDWLFTRPDVRTISKEWIEGNIPASTKIALDYPFHQPRLRFDKSQLTEKYGEAKEAHDRLNEWRLELLLKNYDMHNAAYQLFFLDDGNASGRPLFSKPTIPFQLEALAERGIKYVLVTRLTKQYEHPDFYEKLRSEGRLVKVFTPYRDHSVSYGRASLRQVAAATEGRDLFARERYGDIIEVFKIG